MNTRNNVISILCLCLLAFSSNAFAQTRILFIGNSFTYYNDGLDICLKRFCDSSKVSVITAKAAQGGYTLEQHWNDTASRSALANNTWDYVILQEQSERPITNRDTFFTYAKLLDSEIKRGGAKTVLLMTWSYLSKIDSSAMTNNLAEAYTTLGTSIGALVVPAGLAWKSAYDSTTMTLYVDDKHPTPNGTYLVTCSIFARLFGVTPVGCSFDTAWGILGKDAQYLQSVAWRIEETYVPLLIVPDVTRFAWSNGTVHSSTLTVRKEIAFGKMLTGTVRMVAPGKGFAGVRVYDVQGRAIR